MSLRTLSRAALGAAFLCGALAVSNALAEGLRPEALFVQGGGGQSGLRVAGVGLLWPWSWRAQAVGGEWTLQTELFASHWSARAAGGGREGYTQIGLVPLLRYRLDNGLSNWFVEGGIGLSVTDSQFATPARTLGTEWNFSDNLALGRNFGEQGRHEVSLRWQHTSNAGIKKPNPGLDLLMLRYSTRF